MSITVIEAASNALLTTRETVKRELSITTTDEDEIISDLIVRASSAIARETRRVFGVETVTETMDGTGSRLLGLTRTPIVEVTEVTEDGTAITDWLIEDAEAGALYRPSGWGISGGLRMWGTEAFASGYILPGYRDQRYSVTYRAGYLLPSDVNPYILPADPQNLPGAVEQACVETVKAAYFARDSDAAVGLVKVGNLSVSYRDQGQSATAVGSLPPSALGLLRNYYQGVLR
jgi:hypothetical protein